MLHPPSPSLSPSLVPILVLLSSSVSFYFFPPLFLSSLFLSLKCTFYLPPSPLSVSLSLSSSYVFDPGGVFIVVMYFCRLCVAVRETGDAEPGGDSCRLLHAPADERNAAMRQVFALLGSPRNLARPPSLPPPATETFTPFLPLPVSTPGETRC